ncbi:MAG: Phosphatidate cytidylyltransferase [candidate division WS2 bacterium]|nr:Phosphatidate cytidylyltransferase [Candidatus Lithacetigena glycinireducens]
MSELTKRTITALILAPIVLYTTWISNPYPFFYLIVFIMTLCWWEIVTMKNIDTPILLAFGGWVMFTVNLYLFLTQQFHFLPFFWAISSVITLVSLFMLVEPERGRRVFNRLLVGIIYLGFLLPFILLLKIKNPHWALLALMLTWIFDAGSYFIGKSFGKHAFMPRISPKKSWEGFLGGLAIVIISAILIGPYLGINNLALKLSLALIVALLATSGDLSESFIKRAYGVKDSSSLLPGHGGFLDRIDSLCFVFLGFYMVYVFGGKFF